MEEKCASAAICFVSFLPDILDSKAEGRNKYLELLLSVAEKFKKSPYRQVFFFPENFGRSSAFQYRPYQNVSSSSHSKKGKTSRV
jgi:hypothetical protein